MLWLMYSQLFNTNNVYLKFSHFFVKNMALKLNFIVSFQNKLKNVGF